MTGCYPLHTCKAGTIVGMMSIDTGAVWHHTWHGAFTAMTGG